MRARRACAYRTEPGIVALTRRVRRRAVNLLRSGELARSVEAGITGRGVLLGLLLHVAREVRIGDRRARRGQHAARHLDVARARRRRTRGTRRTSRAVDPVPPVFPVSPLITLGSVAPVAPGSPGSPFGPSPLPRRSIRYRLCRLSVQSRPWPRGPRIALRAENALAAQRGQAVLAVARHRSTFRCPRPHVQTCPVSAVSHAHRPARRSPAGHRAWDRALEHEARAGRAFRDRLVRSDPHRLGHPWVRSHRRPILARRARRLRAGRLRRGSPSGPTGPVLPRSCTRSVRRPPGSSSPTAVPRSSTRCARLMPA